FRAAWSLVLFGDRAALHELLAFADGGARFVFPAVMLGLRVAATSAAAEWIAAREADPTKQRLAILGAGASGDPGRAPWLLECMAKPELARLAGASLSLITGVDLVREKLTADPPPDFVPATSEDAADDRVALDPDDPLPWPARDAVAQRVHR